MTEQNLESLGPIEPFQEAGLGKPSVLATTEPRARFARAQVLLNWRALRARPFHESCPVIDKHMNHLKEK